MKHIYSRKYLHFGTKYKNDLSGETVQNTPSPAKIYPRYVMAKAKCNGHRFINTFEIINFITN